MIGFEPGLGGFVSILTLVAMIWALYDILAKSRMEDIRKLIWVIVVLVLPLIGVILYYIIEKN